MWRSDAGRPMRRPDGDDGDDGFPRRGEEKASQRWRRRRALLLSTRAACFAARGRHRAGWRESPVGGSTSAAGPVDVMAPATVRACVCRWGRPTMAAGRTSSHVSTTAMCCGAIADQQEVRASSGWLASLISRLRETRLDDLVGALVFVSSGLASHLRRWRMQGKSGAGGHLVRYSGLEQ